jgi:ankyrin repeat protein
MKSNIQLNEILIAQDTNLLLNMLENGVQLNEIEIDLFDVLLNFFNSDVKVNEAYIKLLIENEIQLQKASARSNTTLLMLSASLGLDIIIVELISRGFDLNDTNLYGMNTFHWAVAYGQYSTAKMLMEKGADIHAKVEFEVCYYEREKTKAEKLETLHSIIFEEVYDDDRNHCIKKVQLSSFAIAFNTYHPMMIQWLIEKGFDPNEKVLDEKSLFRFLKDSDVVDASYLNESAASIACHKNDFQTLKLLIDNGASNFTTSDLAVACKNLNLEMIKLLVENGVEVNDHTTNEPTSFNWINIGNPLSIVCRNSAVEPCEGNCASNTSIHGSEVIVIIKYLIEHGADANIDSPLMAACSLIYRNIGKKGYDEFYADINTDIINLLIENGADVNFVNKQNGQSILMEAVQKMNGYELTKILVKNGADVNHKDKHQNSCLFHLDSEYPDEEYQLANILTLLLDNGADFHARNNMGMTPLMHYALRGEEPLVKILLEYGADINAISEMTAYDLAQNDAIKALIQESRNNTPQRLVKLLSNFTIDKPIKYTTHSWDFGELKKEYGNFDGYMSAVKKQFDGMKDELQKLSPNLYQKIYTFLIEENPDTDYSWCQKANINLGWSSLKGLREWCDSGKNPFDFPLKQQIVLPPRKQISTFGEVINLFKQEIEVRAEFKNLEAMIQSHNVSMDLSGAKLANRQFYTDTQKLSFVITKIFNEIKKRDEHDKIEVITTELEDRSIELKITQIGSYANKNGQDLLKEANDGDFADIKESLKNLCDWSVESSFEEENFRINYLHSNNVKEIEPLDYKSLGMTHVFRFYV